MRLTTIISLLLFASAACALQLLHHAERRDGFRPSVIRRRSLRPIPRRRLASRRIGSSIGPDMVPRGMPMIGKSKPQVYLEEIILAKHENRVTYLSVKSNCAIYKYKSSQIFGGNEFVVKEIELIEGWTKHGLELEVSRLAIRRNLLGALRVGNKCYVMMRSLGDKWTPSPGSPVSSARMAIIDRNKWDKEHFGLERELPLDYNDFAWTWTDDSNIYIPLATSTGKWRHAKFTGDQKEPTQQYCGILGWVKAVDQGYLPTFEPLEDHTM